MRKVAVLGAGYVVKPMIDYFIDTCKYETIVATRTVSKAEKLLATDHWENQLPGQ